MSYSPLQIFEFTLDFISYGKPYNIKIYLILLNVAAFICFSAFLIFPETVNTDNWKPNLS